MKRFLFMAAMLVCCSFSFAETPSVSVLEGGPIVPDASVELPMYDGSFEPVNAQRFASIAVAGVKARYGGECGCGSKKKETQPALSGVAMAAGLVRNLTATVAMMPAPVPGDYPQFTNIFNCLDEPIIVWSSDRHLPVGGTDWLPPGEDADGYIDQIDWDFVFDPTTCTWYKVPGGTNVFVTPCGVFWDWWGSFRRCDAWCCPSPQHGGTLLPCQWVIDLMTMPAQNRVLVTWPNHPEYEAHNEENPFDWTQAGPRDPCQPTSDEGLIDGGGGGGIDP